ncbi:hypothetical protein WOLCODRAFT_164103 [Wolfiporia cocos MD-104 SS10]|uniref:Uncharacterized protein n=1 Tax=Wolfiporia cocos (strain MD-104) TaxID=742152 RepID=A0A2H3JN52_WOLCO|nr:hypothetical protein WOLCODRAFT_164103 [Wolfiporia cocos MD-104 SS10]
MDDFATLETTAQIFDTDEAQSEAALMTEIPVDYEQATTKRTIAASCPLCRPSFDAFMPAIQRKSFEAMRLCLAIHANQHTPLTSIVTLPYLTFLAHERPVLF